MLKTPQLHPGIEVTDVLQIDLGTRLAADFTEFKNEITEPGYRLARVGAAVVTAATQALDRGRAMVFALPVAFDRSLTYAAEHGLNGVETSGLAGVALGATFGTWGLVVGRSLESAVDQFPKTTQKITENHPVMVEVVSKAVGGFVNPKEMTAKTPDADGLFDVKPYEKRDTAAGKVALGIGRAYKAAILYGTTAYVGMAKINNQTPESRTNLRRVVTAESAAAWGSIGVMGSVAITNGSPQLAESIRDTLTNKPLILSISLGLVGVSAITNKIARRAAQKELLQQ